MMTAFPSLPIPATPGQNVTFHCEFHLHETDQDLYEGVAVGVWERGGISLTLMTVTSDKRIVVNPKLIEEGPEYVDRIYGHLSTNETRNDSSVISVELADVKKSDERSYGCIMYLGPFREPLGTSVAIDVQGRKICSTNKKSIVFSHF